jgi:hypothetical protein
MYLDKKLLGHGLKSFRYLCSLDKYNPLDRINDDNIQKSVVSGVVEIKKKPLSDDSQITLFISQHGNVLKEYTLSGRYKKFFVVNGDSVNPGDNLFSNYEFPNGCNTHPHNFYLHWLSETGIIGFVLFFLLFCFLFCNLILVFFRIMKNKINKINRINKMNFFYLLGLCLSLFPLFPTGSSYNNWLLVIFYLNLGFFINYYKLIKK